MPPPSEPKNIRLQGPQWEPPGYAEAPLDLRRWYWQTFGAIALEVKKDEAARGIGVTGRPLKPVKMQYRRDGATGPPLVPHDFDSRTYKLLAVHVMVDGVTLFWRGHGRKSWSTILGYHAYKHGPRALPVRNTIGISRGGQSKIRAKAFAAWKGRLKKEPPAPKPEPKPKPPRVAKPKPAPPPKPAPKPKPAPPPPPPRPAGKYKVYTELPKRITKPIVFSYKPGKPPTPPPKPAPPPKPKPKPPTLPEKPKPPPPPKPIPPPLPPPTAIEQAAKLAAHHGIAVDVDAEFFARIYGAAANQYVAVYSARKDAITINPGSPMWASPEIVVENWHSRGWLSTAHPEHAIRHEIGHALHARAMGREVFGERNEPHSTPEALAIARRVSKYAGQDTAEFVAEVYAALVQGRILDDEILALYAALGGPAV